jgi:Phage integrase, N-terminal SAM-like domain
MAVTAVRLIRSRDAAGDLVVRLGVGLLDEYLEFLAGRCRPNTVLAVAYDLKVFFTVAGKPPRRVRPVDVLAFMTAQRAGGQGRLQVAGDGAGGVSARTLRRRLSSVSGLYGFLHARGDVMVNPVPRGLPTRRERQRPGQGVPLVRVPRTLPQVLGPAEVDVLTAALRTYRDRAMVAAMVLGGLRRPTTGFMCTAGGCLTWCSATRTRCGCTGCPRSSMWRRSAARTEPSRAGRASRPRRGLARRAGGRSSAGGGCARTGRRRAGR